MPSKHEISRVTIDIPQKDHQKLAQIAEQEGKSVQDIIIESLEERLSSTQKDINLKKAVEEVLKKYAPMLDKLSKS